MQTQNFHMKDFLILSFACIKICPNPPFPGHLGYNEKKFSRRFVAKDSQYFLWFFMTVHHFWHDAHPYLQCGNDAAALSKIHKRNLDDKQVFAFLKFQTASEKFGKGNDSNRVSISTWHYNHQDKFAI